jgi:transcriptional regulator with XRE-family HTH domain
MGAFIEPTDRVPTMVERVELARKVGARLKAARELAGLGQKDAAHRLGYVNPSKLNRIEYATDASGAVPLWLVARAALLYETTTDYLLGVVDDFEHDDEPALSAAGRAVLGLMRDQWERQRARDVRAIVGAIQRVAELESHCVELTRLATGTETALRRVAELNPQWPDMPGGAPLAHHVKETARAARRLCRALTRLHADAAAVRAA